MPAEIGGSYLTNYFLLKPQKNFHRPVTVTLPLKNGAKILPNHTYHIFVASHGIYTFLMIMKKLVQRILNFYHSNKKQIKTKKYSLTTRQRGS